MDKNLILITGLGIDPLYNRTLIILNGLKELGFEIQEYKFSKFNKKTAKNIQTYSREACFTYIPSFCHKSVSFVKKHAVCDVVFDPLISKYMTNIQDYKKYDKISYESLRSLYRDLRSTSQADFVIFDTAAHQEYFIEKYNIPPQKTGIVYVGANTHDFEKTTNREERNKENIRIGFIGNFIPLQGVLKILEAAKLLKDKKNIEFIFIGDGYQYQQALAYKQKNSLSQVTFAGRVSYKDLDHHINNFDLCLGIFGDTKKSNVVIPNKVFNYASCGRPILTMETRAIKEIFEHKKDIFLCKADPGEIANAIIRLKNNPVLLNKIGKNAYLKVCEDYNEKKIASSLLSQYQSFKENSN